MFSLFHNDLCGLDHFPISFVANKIGKRKCFLFCFEAMWLMDSRFMECVNNWWQVNMDESVMYKIAKKLNFVKQNLRRWNKVSFGHIFDNKKSLG